MIPALNEAGRIASVVAYALADPATAEVIVVDDSSIDDTAALARQAGARVVTSTMLGKGASMHDGVLAAPCDFVAYLDGDLAGLRPNIVTDLCRPAGARRGRLREGPLRPRRRPRHRAHRQAHAQGLLPRAGRLRASRWAASIAAERSLLKAR